MEGKVEKGREGVRYFGEVGEMDGKNYRANALLDPVVPAIHLGGGPCCQHGSGVLLRMLAHH